jgi:hypothetical protein
LSGKDGKVNEWGSESELRWKIRKCKNEKR